MSELVPRHHYTFEEYLELEEIASVRHEFYDGEIYAMAGGTPEHAAMTAAITSALGAQRSLWRCPPDASRRNSAMHGNKPTKAECNDTS